MKGGIFLHIRDYMKYRPRVAELLSELPDELLDTILIRHYKADDIIISHCEHNTDTYLILSGVCCSTCNFISGERVWYRRATVDDVFGVLGMFEQHHSFSATIFAKTNVTLAMIPAATMQQCFARYPRFTQEISQRAINRLNFELWRISECNAYPPYAGTITYLIYAYEFYVRTCSPGFQGPVKIIEKRQEIAHYIGITVRTLQRILPIIREEGLIEIRRESIYIDREHYERLKQRKSEYFH